MLDGRFLNSKHTVKSHRTLTEIFLKNGTTQTKILLRAFVCGLWPFLCSFRCKNCWLA